MFELLKDPELYQAVKDEARQAELADRTNDLYFDHQKLTSQPLLQSVLTEVLRLHAVLLLTRTSTEPVTLAGYTLPAGTTVQAPTQIAHRRESVCAFYSLIIPSWLYTGIIICSTSKFRITRLCNQGLFGHLTCIRRIYSITLTTLLVRGKPGAPSL